MATALHKNVVVSKQGTIAFQSPDLREGDIVDVIVVTHPQSSGPTLFKDLIDRLPSFNRSAADWEKLEANLQRERDAWDQ